MKKIVLSLMMINSVVFAGEFNRIIQIGSTEIPALPHADYILYNIAGFNFYLDDIDDCIKNVLKQNIPWEKEAAALLREYTIQGTTALDIGAHIGTHSITLSKSVGPTGKVICFEPQPKIFCELCVNLAANQCDNAVAYNYAVGNAQSVCYLGEPIPNNEGARYLDSKGGEEVHQITIDSLNLSNISIIKIDVENREEYVLEGCRETIRRCKPILFVEIRGNKVKASMDSENIPLVTGRILEQIRSYGYRTIHFSGDDYLALPL